MLRFRRRPDMAFHEILRAALVQAISDVADDNVFPDALPYSFRVSTKQEVQRELRRLRAAVEDETGLYETPAYQACLLHEVLCSFCERFGAKPNVVGRYEIGTIDLDALVARYFTDLQCLALADEFLDDDELPVGLRRWLSVLRESKPRRNQLVRVRFDASRPFRPRLGPKTTRLRIYPYRSRV